MPHLEAGLRLCVQRDGTQCTGAQLNGIQRTEYGGEFVLEVQ